MRKAIKLLSAGALAMFLLCFPACKRELRTTTISIADEHRHYYPVLMGEKVKLAYEIENTGENPLVISEIQTTCGCLHAKEGRTVVPAGEKTVLDFEFDSSKNLGYVQHEILLYGNFDSTSVYKIGFDIHVIPHADYTRDYELMFEKTSGTADGRYGRYQENYYVDEP